MPKEKEIFIEFLREKGLKLTKQREEILTSFLKVEKHLSTEDLYGIVKRKNFNVGQATVFRTLKLLSEAGIAREINLADRTTRFECSYNRQHHDHMICLKCGKIIEFQEQTIKKLRDKVCKSKRFYPLKHTFKIFGLCKECEK